MGAFEYRQAQEIRDALLQRGVRYLFLGKSGAILLGFPDTTQDADLFVDRSPENCRSLVAALRQLGFALTAEQAAQVERGKDFVQLKNGPFDLDLVFAPDGIERFEDAWKRRGRRVPGLSFGRHHRKQSGDQSAQGLRIASSVTRVPRVLVTTS